MEKQFLLPNSLPSLCTNLLCVLLFLFLFLYLSMTEAVIHIPGNKSIPAVIMFGDSIVDTGNNNNIKTIFKVNFPPYGKDFMGGKPTGRFCDGKVPSDLFVEELGIKGLLPPYMDPNLQTDELPTGVNFASGGAGYDPLTSQLASVISLSDQIELFKEYVEKLKGIVGEERTSSILSDSLYMNVAGSNDIANTFYTFHVREVHYDLNTYTDLMVSSASAFVQDLYRLGARRIGVFGVPPIGCVPAQRTLAGGAQRDCAEKYNEASQLFNRKLGAEIESLNKNLPDARMVYIDIYDLPLDLIYHPPKYGFEVGDKGCCGTGNIEVSVLCSYTCTDVSRYVFWDSFHLTEKAYRLLVRQILKKYLKRFLL